MTNYSMGWSGSILAVLTCIMCISCGCGRGTGRAGNDHCNVDEPCRDVGRRHDGSAADGGSHNDRSSRAGCSHIDWHPVHDRFDCAHSSHPDESPDDSPDDDLCRHETSPATQAPTPPPTNPPTSPPTKAPTAPLNRVAWDSHIYRVDCPDSVNGTIRLAKGYWEGPNGPLDGSVQLGTVIYGDVTGDGKDDALVDLQCSTGGSTGIGMTVVFTNATGKVEQVGEAIDDSSGPTIEPGGFAVTNDVYLPTDAHCCPSGQETDHYALRGGKWILVRKE